MTRQLLSIFLFGSMLFSTLPGVCVSAEEQKDNFLVSVESENAGNIFFDKEPIKINVNFINNDSKNVSINADYTVENGDGLVVSEGDFDEIVLTGKSEKTQELALGTMDYDTYVLKVYTNDSENSQTSDFQFSSVVKADSKNQNDSLGVATHMCWEARKPTIPINSELIDSAGITWIRDEYYWDSVEKEKGKYEFKNDDYINAIAEKGINILLVLSYGNSLYGGTPHDEEGYKSYAEYCKAMATHLKGKVDTFEIWNEWNGGFGSGYSATEYAYMLKAAYSAIKEANPEAMVVACSTADVDMGWIKSVLDLVGAEYMDAISIHPYAYPASPESGGLKSNIKKVHALAKEYGKDLPVWCTEMGYPSSDGVIDETTAAAYKARIYIYGKSINEKDKLFLYDFQNDGNGSSNNENNFGMIRYFENENVPYAAKKGYLAISNATNIIGDAKFCEVTAEDDKLQIYRFEKGDENILSLWTLDGISNIGVDVGTDEVVLTDWFGNAKTIKTVNGVVTVTANERPLYISGKFNSYKITDCKFDFIEKNISAAKGEEINLSIKRGESLDGIEGTFKLNLPQGFELKSDANFSADSKPIMITLNTSELIANGNYAISLQAISKDKILGEISTSINVVDESEIRIVPVLTDLSTFNKWKINVSIKNNSHKNNISGKFEIIEPKEYSGQTFEISDIPFGETNTISIDVKEPPKNKLIPLKLKFIYNNGDTKEITRNVSCLGAVKVTGDIKIDGVIETSEWGDSMPFYLDDISKISGYKSAGELEVYGGAKDISGNGYLKWDDNAFYMAIQVQDDSHVQSSSGSGIWQGDGLQFCIDPCRNKGIGINDWHEIGIAVTNKDVTEMWKWLSIPGISGGEVKDYTGVAHRDEVKKSTMYEIKIPWKQLLPLGTSISAGDIIGYSVIANEDDGLGRDGWIQYMGGIGNEKDANQFGDVILLDSEEKVHLSDSTHQWADIAANVLYKKGVISSEYNGQEKVSKGEFVAMLIRAMNKQNEKSNVIFEGLDTEYEYYNELCVAKEMGIAFDDGENYNILEPLKRQDMITILDRAANSETMASLNVLMKFNDFANIAEYAKQSVANLVERNVIVGDGECINPLDDTIKAEATLAVYNFIQK